MAEPAGGFSRLSEHELIGGTIRVVTAYVEVPGGQVVERLLVRHPGAVVIVPVRGDSAFLVRQYRVATDGLLLELPAGKRDVDGEAPELTAHRELEEEVGFKAGRMQLIGRFYNSPGFSDEFSYCYLATQLTEAQASPQGPEEEHMEIVEVALKEVPEMISSGEILDAKTIIGLLLARQHLEQAFDDGAENARS